LKLLGAAIETSASGSLCLLTQIINACHCAEVNLIDQVIGMYALEPQVRFNLSFVLQNVEHLKAFRRAFSFRQLMMKEGSKRTLYNT
jgi:hypothetical protein